MGMLHGKGGITDAEMQSWIQNLTRSVRKRLRARPNSPWWDEASSIAMMGVWIAISVYDPSRGGTRGLLCKLIQWHTNRELQKFLYFESHGGFTQSGLYHRRHDDTSPQHVRPTSLAAIEGQSQWVPSTTYSSDHTEQREYVRHLIDKLTDFKTKQVIEMLYLQECSASEVASKLGVTRQYVYYLRQQGFKLMKQVLEQESAPDNTSAT